MPNAAERKAEDVALLKDARIILLSQGLSLLHNGNAEKANIFYTADEKLAEAIWELKNDQILCSPQ